MAVITPLDIEALCLVKDVQWLTRLLNAVINTKFGAVAGTSFENNTIQYNTPSEQQDMIRMLMLAIKAKGGTTPSDNDVYTFRYHDPCAPNVWR